MIDAIGEQRLTLLLCNIQDSLPGRRGDGPNKLSYCIADPGDGVVHRYELAQSAPDDG